MISAAFIFVRSVRHMSTLQDLTLWRCAMMQRLDLETKSGEIWSRYWSSQLSIYLIRNFIRFNTSEVLSIGAKILKLDAISKLKQDKETCCLFVSTSLQLETKRNTYHLSTRSHLWFALLWCFLMLVEKVSCSLYSRICLTRVELTVSSTRKKPWIHL